VTDAAPVRSAFGGFRPVTLRWSDVDIYGHVNNAAYYLFVDTAVNEWLIHHAGEDLRQHQQIGVVAETGCQFAAQIDFPGQIEVGLAVARIGRSSVTYRFGIFVAGQDSASAYGRFVHVYVDRDSRRPSSVPDPVRSALALLPEVPL
jgi:acyl-CoA thioester hydrolase